MRTTFLTYLDKFTEELALKVEHCQPEDIHKMLVYAITEAALMKHGFDVNKFTELVKFRKSLPTPRVRIYKWMLLPISKLLEITAHISENAFKPIIAEEGALKKIINALSDLGKVDSVLMYDCLSLPEFLTLSVNLKSRGFKTVFWEYLINPLGTTSYVTNQIIDQSYSAVLSEVVRCIANTLKASYYMKSSYLDKIVHTYGEAGLEEFLAKIDLESIINEIVSQASGRRILLMTDHGYDIVLYGSSHIYVKHGAIKQTKHSKPLVILSKLALTLVIQGV